jgi:hypothetical protein
MPDNFAGNLWDLILSSLAAKTEAAFRSFLEIFRSSD